MGNEVLVVKQQNQVSNFIETSKNWQLFASHLPAQKKEEITFDLFAYINKNAETVAKMELGDFMGRVIECYTQGFSLKDGDGYVLPFKGTATFVPGYKGIVRKAMETGLFKYFDVSPVYKEAIARFDHRRNIPVFDETYIPTGKEKTIGYYGFSETHDGMIREIYHSNEYFQDFARRKSPQNKGKSLTEKLIGPWGDDFEAMCMKTLYKELGKLAPRVTNPTKSQEQFYSVIDMEEPDERDENVQAHPQTIDQETGEVLYSEELGEDLPFPIDPPVESPKKRAAGKTTPCELCGAPCSEKVANFSKDKYGRVLCYACQKAV